MTVARTSPRASEVRQGGARFTLFVEGNSDDGLDPVVLSSLLDDTGIRVEPLGPCFSVSAAAEALQARHPEFFFLVDRDTQSDDDVERSWERFADPATRNLLIWRRRELESYFLIPGYLAASQFLHRPRAELERRILEAARQRVFMDAANRVIVTLRDEMRAKWIELFGNPQELATREDALARLLARPELETKRAANARLLSADRLENRFAENVDILSGGEFPLQFGSGRWLELMCAKPIFRQVINTCFRVQSADGGSIEGTRRQTEVAKRLLQLPDDQQPEDFRQLRRLIAERAR